MRKGWLSKETETSKSIAYGGTHQWFTKVGHSHRPETEGVARKVDVSHNSQRHLCHSMKFALYAVDAKNSPSTSDYRINFPFLRIHSLEVAKAEELPGVG